LPCRSPPGRYSPRLPRNVMRDRGTRWCWASLLASSPSRQPGCIRSGSSVRRGGVRAPPGRVRIAGARAGQCGGADLLHPPPGPLHPDPMPSWARSSGRLGGSSTTWIPTGPATWNRAALSRPTGLGRTSAGWPLRLPSSCPARALIRAAARQDLVVWLARQVGDHVVAGTPLAFA
jgi:hypothetical protein